MARLTRETVRVPADLRTFVSRRWIKAALDENDMHLGSLARRVTRSELYKNWYAVVIIAPARYRAALWEAVGESAGDQYFNEIMRSSKVSKEVLASIASRSREEA